MSSNFENANFIDLVEEYQRDERKQELIKEANRRKASATANCPIKPCRVYLMPCLGDKGVINYEAGWNSPELLTILAAYPSLPLLRTLPGSTAYLLRPAVLVDEVEKTKHVSRWKDIGNYILSLHPQMEYADSEDVVSYEPNPPQLTIQHVLYWYSETVEGIFQIKVACPDLQLATYNEKGWRVTMDFSCNLDGFEYVPFSADGTNLEHRHYYHPAAAHTFEEFLELLNLC